jgi:hypothetical protein
MPEFVTPTFKKALAIAKTRRRKKPIKKRSNPASIKKTCKVGEVVMRVYQLDGEILLGCGLIVKKSKNGVRCQWMEPVKVGCEIGEWHVVDLVRRTGENVSWLFTVLWAEVIDVLDGFARVEDSPVVGSISEPQWGQKLLQSHLARRKRNEPKVELNVDPVNNEPDVDAGNDEHDPANHVCKGDGCELRKQAYDMGAYDDGRYFSTDNSDVDGPNNPANYANYNPAD